MEISADFVRQMRESDPNAALRACGLPVLLTYSGQDAVPSEATMAGRVSTVQSLPGGTVETGLFAQGDHNYNNADAAVDAQLDADLCRITTEFLTAQLKN